MSVYRLPFSLLNPKQGLTNMKHDGNRSPFVKGIL
jgi:hypothetical protein